METKEQGRLLMATARGFVKSDGVRLVGTFDIGGSPRYVAVNIKPLNQPFECINATLTYHNITQLDGACKWMGTAGRDDLQMDFGGGVSITGPLITPRSSICMRGAGSWGTFKSDLPVPPSNNTRNDLVNSAPSHDIVRNTAKVTAREQQLIDLGVPIIAIFGPSGVGKSTFINLIALEQQEVGKGLQSCTSQISAIEARVGGERIVVIDTPGFDNTGPGVLDEDVLASITEYLGSMAERKVYVTGVLILHRINDIVLSQSAYGIATMLKNLYGSAVMSNVMICTTMWDRVTEDEGGDLLDDLCKTGVWGEMFSTGAGTAKIDNVCSNAKEEAEKIVTQLIKNAQPVEPAIQDDMVHQKPEVTETSVGKHLHAVLQDEQTEVEREMEKAQMKVGEKSEVAEANAWEVIHVQEVEGAGSEAEAEEQRREQKAQAEGLQQGWQKLKRELQKRRERMGKNEEAESTINKVISARGMIKCDGNRLVGSFDVDGHPRYITGDVQPPDQPFHCGSATLTYGSAAQLDGACNWHGTAGNDDLRMDFGEGVSISGALAAPRSSMHIRGTGAWSKVKPRFPSNQANESQGRLRSLSVIPFSSRDRNAVRDIAKTAREQQLLESKAPIIAIFGQSGTGKSTFINLIASEKQMVGKGLQSCTSEISVLQASIGGQRVVILDTPSIDDTRANMKEADVLISIAKYLGTMGERKVWVTGVLFMHRISDNKFSQTADRVSTMLKNLCGDAAMNHLMLCTTMWDRVLEEEGYERFDGLCETGAWKEMISKGAGTAMISNMSPNAKAEAEKIVSQLIENAKPVEIAIQDEMVNQKLTVAKTGAGQVLDEHLREVQAKGERELMELRDRLREENEANAAKALAEIHAREEEVARLKAWADEQARERQAQAEQLKREQDKLKREMKELREQARSSGDVSAVKAQEELLARERAALQLKQQAEELNGDQKIKAKQFKQERMNAIRDTTDMQKFARREAAAQAAKAKEETLAQQREINEVKKQVAALAGKPQRSGLLKMFGLS